MAVTINTNTFPAEGGSFTVQITKDTNRPWNVVLPSAAWITNVIGWEQSNHLYEINFDLDENTGVSDRQVTFTAGDDFELESFTLTQYGTGTTISAEVISASPSADISASGGQLTVDIYSNGGNDALTSASSADSFCTLTSTTHGVSSGGYTCTRFVFTFAANSNPSTRTAHLTFTVSDGNNTATATLNKIQRAALVQQGSLVASDMSVAANATSAQGAITATDMDTSTLSASGTAAWVTGAAVTTIAGVLYVTLNLQANTGASSRSDTITVTGTDNWGNTITTTCTILQAGTGVTRKISPAWRTGLGYDGVLTWEGGREQALITFTGAFTGDTSISYGTLPDGLTIALPNNTILNCDYVGGNIPQTIVIPITISRLGTDNVTYTAVINLMLRASGVYPIWEDTMQTIVTDEDWEDYELQEGGSPFYTGRAFKYQGEVDILVNVARVVAPYLTGYFKDVTFVNDGNTLGLYTFVRDYSYDRSMDYSQNQWLNAPVNGKIPAGIKVSVSEWAKAASGSLQVTDEGGSLVVNEALVKGLNMGEWISGSAGKKYTFGSLEYEVVDVCHGALLKYVNAYGAVDFLLLEGVAKKSDKITRASYEKDAAALSQEFESKDYQATMEAQWSGSTGWLTDAQSARMKHLVESVEVYMIDISTGDEIPVCMTDGNLDYKTFISNGRKLINYTLKWSESQKKIRR